MRGDSSMRWHGVGVARWAAPDKLRCGGARLQEQRSSIGSGPTDGPLGVEECQAWLGRLRGF
jgi:hypothetical protein